MLKNETYFNCPDFFSLFIIMNTIITAIISIFNTTVDQVSKYGKGVVLWLTVLGLFSLMLVFFLKQNDHLFARIINQQSAQVVQAEQRHSDQVEDRRTLNVQVYNMLNKFFYSNRNVMNLAILEHHNGTNSLNGRKSFLYISNTFELCRFNDSHYSNIQHINMSLFNIYNIMYSNNYRLYHNTINELKRDDMKLYSIVQSIRTSTYIYCIEIVDLNDISVASLFVVTNDIKYNESFANQIKILSNNLSLILI